MELKLCSTSAGLSWSTFGIRGTRHSTWMPSLVPASVAELDESHSIVSDCSESVLLVMQSKSRLVLMFMGHCFDIHTVRSHNPRPQQAQTKQLLSLCDTQYISVNHACRLWKRTATHLVLCSSGYLASCQSLRKLLICLPKKMQHPAWRRAHQQ